MNRVIATAVLLLLLNSPTQASELPVDAVEPAGAYLKNIEQELQASEYAKAHSYILGDLNDDGAEDLLLDTWYKIVSWNWSGIIQSITGIGLLSIAFVALTSWRHQQRSQAVVKLLDQLTDSIHEFVYSISPAIHMLKLIHISIKNQKHNPDLNQNLEHSQTISFIEQKGRVTADSLKEILTTAEKPAFRIRSLLVKGQILGISNYHTCQNTCSMIVWQIDRLQLVYKMLYTQDLNWENTKIIETLGGMMDITPDDITTLIEKNQEEFLKFVNDTYDQEYNRKG
ncbi:MAG: hypothetical protein ACI8ZB_002659 [Desulforhopalus sp.]|jgi:uncharacterized protein YggT (Ycf19 family)